MFSVVRVRLARSRGSGPCEAGGQEGETRARIDGNSGTLPPDHSVACLHTPGLAGAIVGGWVQPGPPAPCGLGEWGRALPRVGAVQGSWREGRHPCSLGRQVGQTQGPDPGLRQKQGGRGNGCVTAWGHQDGMMKQYGNWHQASLVGRSDSYPALPWF